MRVEHGTALHAYRCQFDRICRSRGCPGDVFDGGPIVHPLIKIKESSLMYATGNFGPVRSSASVMTDPRKSLLSVFPKLIPSSQAGVGIAKNCLQSSREINSFCVGACATIGEILGLLFVVTLCLKCNECQREKRSSRGLTSDWRAEPGMVKRIPIGCCWTQIAASSLCVIRF